MLVLSPAFRSMALGIMLSVLFVLAATLTLLPACRQARPRSMRCPLSGALGEHRSPAFARWRAALRRPHVYGPAATLVLVLLALPVVGLKTGMPSIKVVPKQDSSRIGYAQVQQAFGAGAPGTLQIVALGRTQQPAASFTATRGSHQSRLFSLATAGLPSSRRSQMRNRRARRSAARSIGSGWLCPRVLVGGASAENHDLEQVLAAKRARDRCRAPLGFLLLLVALQAPLIALSVATTCSPRAAFGSPGSCPERHGSAFSLRASGFLDAWAGLLLRDDLRHLDDYTVSCSLGQGALRQVGDPRDASSTLAHSAA